MSKMIFYPNTELGIDLKLMIKEPGRMAVGEYLDGAITHDGEDHFTFVQNDLLVISPKIPTFAAPNHIRPGQAKTEACFEFG
jgi:hypothetical protein